jgi:group I intron endonuclease
MRKYGIVYKITNLKTGKSYVGQTVESVKERFYAHYQDKRANTYVGNALRSEGRQNFIFEELFIAFDKESLNLVEKLLVEQLNTLYPNGYNLRPGGSQYGKMS